MAKTGSIIITQKSQNIANNTSTIEVVCKITTSGDSWRGDQRSGTCTIDGTTYNFTHGVNKNSTTTIFTKTVTVSHDSNGKKTVSASFNYDSTWCTASTSKTLTTISRATVPTLSSKSVNFGATVTINTPRSNNTFTHTLQYAFVDSTYTNIAKDVGISYTWTIPVSLMSKIPNAAKETITIKCITYNGSTKIGENSITLTANVQSTYAPTFTLGATRVDNGVPSTFGIYVESFSECKIEMTNITGQYGATIKSYNISGGGYSSDKSIATLGPFIHNGEHTSFEVSFEASVTDSRGLIATKTVSITVYDYTPPTLSIKAERCDSSGNISNTGTYVKITPTYSCHSVNGKNSITSKSFSIEGTSYSNTSCSSGSSVILGSGAISTSSKYKVKASVTDALGKTAVITQDVGTSEKTVNILASKLGIAFGGFSTLTRVVDFFWDIKLRKDRIIRNDGSTIDLSKVLIFVSEVND